MHHDLERSVYRFCLDYVSCFRPTTYVYADLYNECINTSGERCSLLPTSVTNCYILVFIIIIIYCFCEFLIKESKKHEQGHTLALRRESLTRGVPLYYKTTTSSHESTVALTIIVASQKRQGLHVLKHLGYLDHLSMA